MPGLELGRRATLVVLVLVLVSPVFGVTLADLVGYHEPLDVAAEALGLEDRSEEMNWTPFFDYGVPGLPPELGYIVAGLIGVAAILAIGYLVSLLRR